MFNFKRFFGIVFVLMGIVVILNAFFSFTGFVIGGGVEWKGSVWGAVFIIAGFFLIRGTLDSGVNIYGHDGEGRLVYYLSDPKNLFGKKGFVGVDEFILQCNYFRNNPEFLEIVKRFYIGALIRIAEEGGKHSDVAKKCLGALNLGYFDIADGFHLTDSEKEEIRGAFSSWSGSPDSRQSEVLFRYGLKYEKANPISRIYTKYGQVFVSNSAVDDFSAGRIAVKIERLYAYAKSRRQRESFEKSGD